MNPDLIFLDDCQLSIRTCNALKSAGIECLSDLLNQSEYKLLKIRNLGRKSLNEIKKFKIDNGYLDESNVPSLGKWLCKIERIQLEMAQDLLKIYERTKEFENTFLELKKSIEEIESNREGKNKF